MSYNRVYYLLQGGFHVLLVVSVISLTGAELPIPVQVVPQGIKSVNGSDVKMGCASPPANIGDVKLCGTPLADIDNVMCGNSESYMVDSNSPAIDTSTSNWASQLVTVRKNKKNDGIDFDHVVLTFGFDTAVSLIVIELDLFLCPEWNIGAPFITVYAEEYNSDLMFRHVKMPAPTLDFIGSKTPSQSSCDSLSTVSILLQYREPSFSTWHIVVSFELQPYIEWVHLGEVRFFGSDSIPTSICRSTPKSTSSLMSSTSLTTTPMESTRGTISPSNTSTPTESTKHSTSQVSSASPRTTVINNPMENNSTTLLLIALVPGIAVVMLGIISVVILVGLCFVRRNFPSRVRLEGVQSVAYKLKGITKEQDDRKSGNSRSNGDHCLVATNHELEVSNPMYSIINKQVSQVADGLYDEIATGKTSTPVKGGRHNVITNKFSAQKTTSDERDDEWIGMYEAITPKPAVTTTKASTIDSAAYVCVQGEEQHCTIPELATSVKVEHEAESDQSLHIYSGIQKRKAPTVPSKSSDLEFYLATHSAFNEGIYSESINASDFTHCGSQESEEMEEKESDLQIFAPIYTVPTMLPEGFQQPIEITSDNIKEKEDLGTGQFGKVILATTNGLSLKDMQLSKTDDNQDTSIHVAVKKLKPNPSEVQQEAFDKEVKFMSCLKHQNIVCILGVCYRNPTFIMMEYMEKGELNQFLQRYSEIVPITTPSNNAQITTSTVVHMASQIVSAMQYLAGLTFVHRDLATRNCLVGTNFTVKVADLGVNTNLYRSHYYRVKGNMLLPIRWMATECFDGKFSEKSDVWAFGITMWELFTLSKDKPYPNLSDEEVIHNALKRKHRHFPSRSIACPQLVYEIMEKCWVNLKDRATFQEITETLQRI